MQNTPDDILSLLLKLCAIPSVTGEPGAEDLIPEYLRQELSEWDYFRTHPKNIWLEPLKDDHMNRNNFCALVEAEPATPNTLVLISHHDVVATDVCGHLSDIAFIPQEYTERLKTVNISQEATTDLNSGKWLFGRGVSDMKGGMAVQIGLLAEAARSPQTLKTNILLMTLADEENNGFGVHQAVRMLVKMQEKGYKFIACIDSEPTITNQDKDRPRVYTGSIGNATMFAMCIGKESHVGEFFQGINSTLIASKLIEEIEGDPASSDEWMGTRYSPYTCLQVRKMGKGYSVTLPERTAVTFNVLMVNRTPAQLMEYIKDKAKTAMDNALGTLYHRRNALRDAGYRELPETIYPVRVMTYKEFFKSLAEKMDVAALQKDFLNRLDSSLESQDRGIELANYLLDVAGIKGPVILVGLLSPYCQPRVNRRQDSGELLLMQAVANIIKTAREKFNIHMVQEEVYEGISDMSEMGYQGTPEDIEILTGNLIGWGDDLKHPFKEMQQLNIPVMNLGPIGKDAHKLTERVYLPFLLEILPALLKELVDDLGKNTIK